MNTETTPATPAEIDEAEPAIVVGRLERPGGWWAEIDNYEHWRASDPDLAADLNRRFGPGLPGADRAYQPVGAVALLAVAKAYDATITRAPRPATEEPGRRT